MFIEDTDEVPRSRKDGYNIPPELKDAVEDSLTNNQPKNIKVGSEDEAQYIMKLLYSMTTRKEFAYKITKRVIRDQQKKAVSVRFLTTGREK